MTVNRYFSEHKVKTEQDLVESIITEMIQISGFDISYIPRTQYNPDSLLSEDINSTFDQYKKIEAYLVNATEYGGAGFYFEKFGMVHENNMEFVISRRRWYEETGTKYPREGDLVYISQNKGLFQIDEVDFETAPYFQLQKNYVFTLRTSLFSYSYEKFDTGIDELDMNLADITDPFADNQVINDEAEKHLDFTEENPFGELIE